MLFLCLVALLVYSLLEQRARQAGLPLTGRKVLERFAVCSVVRTTFADGTTLLLAVPYSAWQQTVARALALPDPNHWLVPLDPLPTLSEEARLSSVLMKADPMLRRRARWLRDGRSSGVGASSTNWRPIATMTHARM